VLFTFHKELFPDVGSAKEVNFQALEKSPSVKATACEPAAKRQGSMAGVEVDVSQAGLEDPASATYTAALMIASSDNAILLIACPDREGIVAAVTHFIATHHGNIVDLEQHVDPEHATFLMRVEWAATGFTLEANAFGAAFAKVADPFAMTWELRQMARRPRMAIWVSREPHCLYDLLARYRSGEWSVDVPLVLGNHDTLRPLADQFGIPFHHVPITPETKAATEATELALMRDQGIDTIVLARYMQIVGPTLIDAYPNRLINIHHSFLPAFPGARPYHSAYERGVKIIGATSHYVTAELDCGPIIEQDVTRVSHKDSVPDLIRKGRDLEKVVLARAITAHLEHRLLVVGNRTVVFS
jgi:formyltetrahydrofolate deformylase